MFMTTGYDQSFLLRFRSQRLAIGEKTRRPSFAFDRAVA